jgi:predicted transcriptional regulator
VWDDQSPDIFSSPEKRFRGRRSRTEMMVDVLRAVHGGAERPTQVMYRSNLSWLVCQDLLRRSSARGFIRAVEEGGRKRYVLTPAGVDVLGRFVRAAEEMRGEARPRGSLGFTRESTRS